MVPRRKTTTSLSPRPQAVPLPSLLLVLLLASAVPSVIVAQRPLDTDVAAAARTSVTSPTPAAAGRREQDSSSTTGSQSDAAVKELTSLLLKGQTLLLEVAEKQNILQEQGLVGIGGFGSASEDEASKATDVTPQTSTRLTFDTLAFDEAAATVDAVLSGFLSDLATNSAFGEARVSAQGSDEDEDEAKDGTSELNNNTTSTTSTHGRKPGCLPSIYATPTRQPPKLLGGALAIVFNGGECRVVQGLLLGTRKIECDSPSIEYALVPPGFEWTHESPEMWAGESCAGGKTRCAIGSAGTPTSASNHVDVPITEHSDRCRAASKDSLIDSAFEDDAVLFKLIHG